MDCFDFSRPWNYSDLVVLCQSGVTFYVHKCVLSMWSDTFGSEISKRIGEDETKTGHMELDAYRHNAEDMREFLEAIYPPNKPINDNNVLRLLGMANGLESWHLRRQCEDYLLSNAASLELLLLAEKWKLVRLRERCIQFASSIDETSLETNVSFRQLSVETRLQVYRQKVLLARSKLENIFNTSR